MNTRVFYLVALTAAMTACSSMPDRNIALDQARNRVTSAQNDPQVASLAPDELKRADESLRIAEQANVDGRTLATVDHLAYMTSQRVTIAQETAANRASQAITAGAAAERDKLRLALRTQEAEAAQQKLAQSQQINEQKTAALAAANANTQRDEAQMERSNAKVDDLEAQLEMLNAKKTDRGMVVTLGDVLFNSGQSRLMPDGARNMIRLADFFKRNPQRTAVIEGYTDNVGSASANYDLSQRRANEVTMTLMSLGVPADRLSTLAHGEKMPTASNSTPTGRQLNRRVEILFAP